MAKALAPDLQRALEIADGAVRRAGGARIGAAHVVAAILGGEAGRAWVDRQGLSLAKLADALADDTRTEGERDYRQTTTITVDDDVDEIIDGCAVGWFAGRPVDGAAFIETFFASPQRAELRRRARFDRAPVVTLINAAMVVKARRGQSRVLVVHAVETLFDDERFREALRVAGVSSEDALERVDEFTSLGLLPLPHADDLVASATRHANVLRLPELGLAAWVPTLLDEKSAEALVTILDVAPIRILYALVHGHALGDGDVWEGNVAATIHDDGFVSAEGLDSLLAFVGTPETLAARPRVVSFVAEGRLVLQGPTLTMRPTVTGLRNAARRRTIPLRIHVAQIP